MEIVRDAPVQKQTTNLKLMEGFFMKVGDYVFSYLGVMLFTFIFIAVFLILIQ